MWSVSNQISIEAQTQQPNKYKIIKEKEDRKKRKMKKEILPLMEILDGLEMRTGSAMKVA